MIFDELDELGKLQLVEASVNLEVKSRWFSVTFHDDSLKSTHWMWDDMVKSPKNQQDWRKCRRMHSEMCIVYSDLRLYLCLFIHADGSPWIHRAVDTVVLWRMKRVTPCNTSGHLVQCCGDDPLAKRVAPCKTRKVNPTFTAMRLGPSVTARRI